MQPNLRVVVIHLSLTIALAFGSSQVCGQAPKQPDIPTLIDKLVELKDGGVGYNATMTGGGFLPLQKGEFHAGLLFQAPPKKSVSVWRTAKKSDVMTELVKHGAKAVPELIAHLDDGRKTGITIDHGFGFGGMFFDDEYDYNERTVKKQPSDVNRELGFRNEKTPNSQVVTVGDLCFVALGQIVNRNFNAVRYQPTACIMINSPTYSERLCKTIKNEWEKLTPEQHKASLVRDFQEPDSEYRRNGACLRLGYYYPEALEPLALKQLAEPRYDVSEVDDLIRKKLYPTQDPKSRRAVWEGVIAKKGEVYRQAILLQLFHDLDLQEADEEGRLHPPLEKKYAARACLVELYGYPKTVKSKERPFLLPTSDSDQARFIETLALFPTPRTDQAVRDILRTTEDDYLAKACARYLVGRNADADIRQYVEQRLKGADERRTAELRAMLDRLGWTPLHVAAELGEPDRIEKLIVQGADINARAANGQTALHVAADHGSYGAIRTLVERKGELDPKDQRGLTPIQLASECDPAVEMLLDAGAEFPVLASQPFGWRLLTGLLG